MLKVLEEDFARIPELLARTAGEASSAESESDEVQPAPAEEAAVQLGLF
jgi:hypothetical protein